MTHATVDPRPRSRTRRVRVASVPAGHVYVRHLADLDCFQDPVTRLPDPRPSRSPQGSRRWWPPVMLDPVWVREHAADFDVFHLHFGFDGQDPAELAALLEELDAQDRPLVYTVHDLHDPRTSDPAPHEANLDLLIPAADALVTLTSGAADRIERRWGRRPEVLPHPHVVDLPHVGRPRPPRDTFTVGVHAGDLPPGTDPLPVVEVVAESLAGLPGARLRVDVHPDVGYPDSPNYTPHVLDRLYELHELGAIDLHAHAPFDDARLQIYLRGLDLAVLPYTFGTHSGLLEECHDLGTPVATSDCGFFAQQRPCYTYRHDGSGLDADALRGAVHAAYTERPDWRASPGRRTEERRHLAAAHHALYLDLL